MCLGDCVSFKKSEWSNMSVGVTFKSVSFNESFIVELGVTGVFI